MNSWKNFLDPLIFLWVLFFAYWIASARGTKPTAYRVNPVWRWVTVIGIFLIVRFWNFDSPLFNRSLVEQTPTTEAVGVVICAAGFAFAIWARRTLATNWSAEPTIKEGHELITAGPYRLVRHPIYTGILVALLGTELVGGRVKNLFLVLFAVVILYVKLRIEESLMMRQFPQAYADYKARTKTLIPYVI
jgi:protein-S-isoprenylcysteine O-methyltransferase Ste14